jgi:hypothetical protein
LLLIRRVISAALGSWPFLDTVSSEARRQGHKGGGGIHVDAHIKSGGALRWRVHVRVLTHAR